MTEIIKETITTQGNAAKPIAVSPSSPKASRLQTVEYLIYFFLGTLEILLAFRLVLKLTGASLASGFVSFIYSLSGILILPFEGIFRRGYTQGIETTSVLEPSTVVAMLVYAVVVWGIVKLLRISSGKQQTD